MRHLLLLAASTCAALLVGCPVSGDRSCEELANCPDDGTDASATDASRDTSPSDASPDGTPQADATTDADAGPPACNTALDPKAAPCVVDDALGVFVAPTGSDTTGNGSKAKPYATITKALAAPKAAMLRAFVCAGTYKEPAVITAAADGMAIYGGLDCATWAYDAANKVIVAPTAHGPALSVTGIPTALTIEDIEFDAQAGTAAGESSIAGVVSGATGVALRRVRLVAGAGVAGTAGTVPSTVLPTPAIGNDAKDAPDPAGGGQSPCSCPFGERSVGGAGGGAGPTPTDGETGLPIGAANKGVTAGTSCTPGGDGAPAMLVAPSGSGAKSLAAVNGTEWTPRSGSKGTAGGTGQGGGGGGAIKDAGNGGGGGGCGGCGGDGGGFGTGGGSSVALLAVSNVRLSLTEAMLIAASGGAGGSGAIGQAGAKGAAPGFKSRAGRGCDGGFGGNGGQGGSGGGGAGGVSVGIAFKGEEPVRDALTASSFVTGTAGLGGIGGTPGTNDGLAGVKQDVLGI
jgi:hypothetical protein